MLKTTDICPVTAAFELDKGEESFRKFLRMNQIGIDHYYDSKTLLLNEISDQNRVALLVKLGANILLPTKNANRLTALHMAAKCYKDQSLNLFLVDLKRSGQIEEGINIKDAKGNTPLHYACITAHEKSIDLLLEYGADTSVRNNEGKLPIECLDELKQHDATQRGKLEEKLRTHTSPNSTQEQNKTSTPTPDVRKVNHSQSSAVEPASPQEIKTKRPLFKFDQVDINRARLEMKLTDSGMVMYLMGFTNYKKHGHKLLNPELPSFAKVYVVLEHLILSLDLEKIVELEKILDDEAEMLWQSGFDSSKSSTFSNILHSIKLPGPVPDQNGLSSEDFARSKLLPWFEHNRNCPAIVRIYGEDDFEKSIKTLSKNSAPSDTVVQMIKRKLDRTFNVAFEQSQAVTEYVKNKTQPQQQQAQSSAIPVPPKPIQRKNSMDRTLSSNSESMQVALEKHMLKQERVMSELLNQRGLNLQLQQKPVELNVNSQSTKSTLTSEITIPKNNLTFGKLLGEGGFGKVYAGKWKHTALYETEVAIKQLKEEDISEKIKAEFEGEVRVHATLNSPGIVKLYGITIEQPYCMVMEYMPNGSLNKYLRSQYPNNVKWTTRIQLAKDIAIGLDYLHSQTPPIIHGDLKSLNVLLDHQHRAKLADFGLATIKKETTTKTQLTTKVDDDGTIRGSILWMAPELFERRTKPSLESDIYAYGMVMYEISSHQYPFEEDLQKGLEVVITYIIKGQTDSFPTGTPLEFKILGEKCLSTTKEHRPSARMVLEMLDGKSRAKISTPSLKPQSRNKESNEGNKRPSSPKQGYRNKPLFKFDQVDINRERMTLNLDSSSVPKYLKAYKRLKDLNQTVMDPKTVRFARVYVLLEYLILSLDLDNIRNLETLLGDEAQTLWTNGFDSSKSYTFNQILQSIKVPGSLADQNSLSSENFARSKLLPWFEQHRNCPAALRIYGEEDFEKSLRTLSKNSAPSESVVQMMKRKVDRTFNVAFEQSQAVTEYVKNKTQAQQQQSQSSAIAVPPLPAKPLQRKNSMDRTQSPTTFFSPARQKTPSPPQGGSLSGSPGSGEHSPKSSDASHTQQDVDEALFKACVEGDLAEAQDLVENYNGNVNYTTTPDNFTPLQASIVRGHPVITKYLLKKNADPNFPNSEGSTPLDLAVTKELTDIVSLLLDAGAIPDPVHSAKELSPLMFAARFGNLRIVQLLTEKGASPTLKSIALNANAIELATAAKHFEIATYLESYNKEKIPNPLLKAIQDGKQQKNKEKTCLVDSVAVQEEESYNIDVTQKPGNQKCFVM